jgi:hypothetical protein
MQPYSKLGDEELILYLVTILEQVRVAKKGREDHPDNGEFKKLLPFLSDEGFKIMKELKKRGHGS